MKSGQGYPPASPTSLRTSMACTKVQSTFGSASSGAHRQRSSGSPQKDTHYKCTHKRAAQHKGQGAHDTSEAMYQVLKVWRWMRAEVAWRGVAGLVGLGPRPASSLRSVRLLTWCGHFGTCLGSRHSHPSRIFFVTCQFFALPCGREGCIAAMAQQLLAATAMMGVRPPCVG